MATNDNERHTGLAQKTGIVPLIQPDATSPDTLAQLSQTESADIIHELGVHKLELETQNEELRRAQAALESAQARYFDLYDLAPVAYVTVDCDGLIIEANLSAANLLGVTRAELCQRSLSDFLLVGDNENRYSQHLTLAVETGEAQSCDLQMVKRDDAKFWVRMEATSVRRDDNASIWRIVLSDITERKDMENTLRERVKELNCLYAIADVIEKENSVQGILQGSIELMPQAWLYPEVACARVIFEGRQYQTENFRETWRHLSAVLDVDGEPAGMIEVAYLDARPMRDEGPFLSEERNLINAIAERLGKVIERFRAQEALKKAQAFLSAALDTSQVGIAIADAPGGTLRYVNDAGLLIRGGDRASVVNGVGIDQYVARWKLMDLDGRPLRVDEVPLVRAIQFGETCRREFIIRRSSDDDRIVLAEATPIRNDAGTVVAAIVAFMDITEYKHAEEALHAEQQFKRTVLDNIGEGVVACDAKGTLALFNRAAREWHGVDALALPAEEWGKHYNLYGPDGSTPLPTESIPLVRAFHGETVRDAKMTIVAKGKSPRHILAAASPFFDVRGNLLGAVAVLHDYTERKRIEEALQIKIEELGRAFEQIKTLRGIVPICASCKMIRDDQGYWEQVDVYVRNHTEAEFSHGLCPTCLKALYPDLDIN